MLWPFARMMTIVALMLCSTRAFASASPGAMSHGRYTGAPDLALTAAVIAAGGGARHFRSAKLVKMLAAQYAPEESRALARRFGSTRMHRFYITFDAFVHRAIVIVSRDHIALPVPSPALVRDPALLSASLFADGKMPDGRFDIGYMIEHLLSRPVHKELMDAIDNDYSVGPGANAEFHTILTVAMRDIVMRDAGR